MQAYKRGSHTVWDCKYHLVLLLLARVFGWESLDAEFGTGYAPGFGRPAVPTRLILGLLMVRQMRDLSDREVVALFLESPYV